MKNKTEFEKIQDPLNYKIPKDDRVLADDLRIAYAWYSSIKQGKKFEYSETQVKNLIKKLVNEILESGRLTIHLEKLKEVTRELILSLIKRKVSRTFTISESDFILRGLQTAILSLRPFKGDLYYIIEAKDKDPRTDVPHKAPVNFSGIINVIESKKIPTDDYLKYFKEHRISEEDFDESYSYAKALYLNRFKLVVTNRGLKKSYANVNSSGEELGDEITLEEILKNFKDYIISDPFIFITGGLVNRGKTKNDIDILIKGDLPDNVLDPVWFRMIRQVPKKYWERFQLIEDKGVGPYTSYVPLYRLKVERIKPAKVVQLSINDINDWPVYKAVIRVKDPKIKREAEQSKKENKIKLFRFFYPLKTSISAIQAYRKGEIYQIDKVIEYFEKLEEKTK